MEQDYGDKHGTLGAHTEKDGIKKGNRDEQPKCSNCFSLSGSEKVMDSVPSWESTKMEKGAVKFR